MKDQISTLRLQQLHPKAREPFRMFIEECEAKDAETTLRIMQGLRTFQHQQDLYNQGRSAKGSIVTNSQAGQSYHNYGLAIDLCELDGANNEKVDWNFDMGKLVDIAAKYGIAWGGNFRSLKDKPHFELTFGKSWRELLALHNSGHVDAEGYVIL